MVVLYDIQVSHSALANGECMLKYCLEARRHRLEDRPTNLVTTACPKAATHIPCMDNIETTFETPK